MSLRDRFADEEEDLNPWICDNSYELGEEVLGFPLVVEDSEKEVGGSRRYDILHGEPITNTHIITELQYGTVDHDHITRTLEYMRECQYEVGFGIIIAENWTETLTRIVCNDIDRHIIPIEMNEECEWMVPRDDMGIPINDAADVWRHSRSRLKKLKESAEDQAWEIIRENITEQIDDDLSWGQSGDRMWFYSDKVTGGEGDIKIDKQEGDWCVRLSMMYKEDKSDIEDKIEEIEGHWTLNKQWSDVNWHSTELVHRDNIGQHRDTGLWIIIGRWDSLVLSRDEIVETAVDAHKHLHTREIRKIMSD